MTGTSAACLHTNQSRSYLNHLVYISRIYMSIFIVTFFKEIRMRRAYGTYGNRRVMCIEFRAKRDDLEDLCEDNINIDLKEIAWEE